MIYILYRARFELKEEWQNIEQVPLSHLARLALLFLTVLFSFVIYSLSYLSLYSLLYIFWARIKNVVIVVEVYFELVQQNKTENTE